MLGHRVQRVGAIHAGTSRRWGPSSLTLFTLDHLSNHGMIQTNLFNQQLWVIVVYCLIGNNPLLKVY